MPIRFNNPSLGGNNWPQLKAHEWQIDVGYRLLNTDQHYLGNTESESTAPFGQPLRLNVNSIDLSVDYGVTNRLSLTVIFPFLHGTQSRFYPDMQRHKNKAQGLGDISVLGTFWLWNPQGHSHSNLSVALGVKTPSGDNAVTGFSFKQDGSFMQSPVDQSIQLGDGGWGVILQTQGFGQLARLTSGYVSASYLLTPREKTNVPSPISGAVLSVPDVYSVRTGIAQTISRKRGFSFSIGPRIDGMPVHDLIGGSSGFRRPGYSLFVDPGVGLTLGRSTFAINVPVRVYQNYERSIADIQHNTPGGGDLARFLVIAEYSFRFGTGFVTH
jgi:hypothetical protein